MHAAFVCFSPAPFLRFWLVLPCPPTELQKLVIKLLQLMHPAITEATCEDLHFCLSPPSCCSFTVPC